MPLETSFILTPVRDRAMGKDVPQEMRDHLAGEAYALRERSGEEMHIPKSDMVKVPNKFTYAGGTAVSWNQQKVEMCFRNILQLGGKNEALSLDPNTPGFKATFPQMPRSFQDVEERLFSQSSWGGNGANLMRDAVVQTLSLPEETRSDMRLNVVTTGRNSFTDSVLELEENHPELIAVQEMPGIPARDGYKIDHEIIHEQGRRDSLILSSQTPSAERIAKELDGRRNIFQTDLFIATEDFGEWTNARMGLVPTSATLESTKLRPGQVLLVNDGELLRILQNRHHQLNGLRFPDVIDGNKQDVYDASNVLRQVFLRIAHATPTKQPTRLATVGKRAGHNASLFQLGSGAIAVEANKHWHDINDDIIRAAESDKIGRNLAEGTGRGDASAAAVLFDHVPLDVLLSMCKESGYDIPYDLTPDQCQMARMLIPEFAGRTNSTLVHFSQESNFAFIDPARYRDILVRFSILPALRCAQQMRAPVHETPQCAQCPETGIGAAAWTIAAHDARSAAA